MHCIPDRKSTILGEEDQLRAIQEHETEIAEIVVVCEPEGSSLTLGGLHPRGSLYERPVNIDAAKKQHAHFREVGKEEGIDVAAMQCFDVVVLPMCNRTASMSVDVTSLS